MTLCDENYKINKVLCCNYLNLCYVFHDVRNLICFANTDLGIEIIFSFQRQKFVFWFLSGWVYSKSRNFINLVEQTCWAELIFWCMMLYTNPNTISFISTHVYVDGVFDGIFVNLSGDRRRGAWTMSKVFVDSCSKISHYIEEKKKMSQ